MSTLLSTSTHPVAIQLVGRRLVVRTGLAVVSLIGGVGLVGAVVVGGLVVLLNGAQDGLKPTLALGFIVACVYVLLALPTASAIGIYLQRTTSRWVAAGREPSEIEAYTALRIPDQMAGLSALLWLLGAGVVAAAVGLVGGAEQGLRIALPIVMGGITVSCLSYLLAERAARPVITLALAACPPQRPMALSIGFRMALTWLGATGVPVLGIVLSQVLPPPPGRDPRITVLALAGVALAVGALGTALVARAVAEPLRRMRPVLERVEHADYAGEVAVSDASEIGLLQTGVNRMLAGLREREQLRTLFEKHVGEEVAEQALALGVDLTGEIRPVVALFVDVVNSSALATQVSPDRMAEMLNRFFTAVVRAVDAENGLVNKFEGDAALCVFNAPLTIEHAQEAALRAARAMRAEIIAAGELDLGIGIAGGETFAGYVGTPERLEYTVIGDAVNEAARLADLAKTLPGRTAVTDQVVSAARTPERILWQRGQQVVLRGRPTPTTVWVPAEPSRRRLASAS